MNKLFLVFQYLALVLLAFKANKVETHYTPYQVMIWSIKANEGFKPDWYRDGQGKNGPKYSIGFGYNDWGLASRRKGINPPITWEKGLELTVREIQTMKVKGDKWQALAFKLHAYNVGPVRTIKELRGCCDAKVGCGSRKENIRNSHNPRRKFEYALATYNWSYVIPVIEMWREKSVRIEVNFK